MVDTATITMHDPIVFYRNFLAGHILGTPKRHGMSLSDCRIANNGDVFYFSWRIRRGILEAGLIVGFNENKTSIVVNDVVGKPHVSEVASPRQGGFDMEGISPSA